MVEERVVVAFADKSLGGVSRSALSAGKMWASLGYRVTFLAFMPTHSGRVEQFESVGEMVTSPAAVAWDHIDLVHLHHSAASSRTLEAIQDLKLHVSKATSPPLMTKNVFAVNDEFLDDWPAARAVGVPGRWTTLQYAYNRGRSLKTAQTWVIPNVQDAEFFRLPTMAEREAARVNFGMSGSLRYILRVGSPIDAKWSRSYVKLAKELAADERLILVGAPESIVEDLRAFDNVEIRDTTSSDEELRSLYWASDMFALDASRGETFGNVAFEALLCGLPVTYRARPYRDNTLWELRGVPGFFYAGTKRQWIQRAMTAEPRLAVEVRDQLAIDYGAKAVQSAYEQVAQALKTAPGGQVWPPAGGWQREVQLVDRVRAWTWHNQFTSSVKKWRLSRQG